MRNAVADFSRSSLPGWTFPPDEPRFERPLNGEPSSFKHGDLVTGCSKMQSLVPQKGPTAGPNCRAGLSPPNADVRSMGNLRTYKTFPNSPFNASDKERFNALSLGNASERTPDEQTMMDLHEKFLMREIYQPPVRRFLEDHTVPGSFQFVGAGATLGEADRIVCWYQLRGASNFRAIYADLVIRDVSEDTLPLRLPER